MSAAAYSKRRIIEVWFVIAGNNTKNNFDKLYEIAHDKSLIEIDAKTDWDRMDEINSDVILRPEADYTKKIELENHFKWLKENIEKFFKFFKPLIRKI